MPTGLKRDLGLPATTAIAIGAMVGSGIFILPGIAYVTTGPAVVVAYLVAGILVLPAAFSASEMATAMPEDGGSYVYVERGMGPLLGTIAGIGNWFMLSFKGALALIGGVPYLVFIAPWLAEYILALAIGLALLFTALNIVSTSSTGSLQFAIVALMIAAMVWFVAGGFGEITPAQTAGAFDVGSEGFLAATALVFISYAGVIKVAAVAEEVKDPGTTIPRAMIGSLVITTALYVLIVYVAIGIVDVGAALELSIEEGGLQSDGEGAIMALAADQALGQAGVIAVVIAALLALASTANAGLLSASRFPFAMARDSLAPAAFERVSERFHTPVLAVGVTGAMMIGMIAFLPIDQVAKFGSAFQIIVFILVNLALIGFREGAIDDYDPAFTSPLYPWMQLFGMAGGFVVLTQVGTLPLLGAIAITIVSIAFYVLYASDRIDREGAARAGARASATDAAIDRTRELFEEGRRYDVLVALTDDTPERARMDMLRMAADLSRLRTGSVTVGSFRTVPHRSFTGSGPRVRSRTPPEWLEFDGESPSWLAGIDDGLRTSGGETITESPERADRSGGFFEYCEIEAEDAGRAIVEFAEFEGYDLVVLERRGQELHGPLSGGVTNHVLRNASSGVLLVEDRGFDGADEIAVAASNGPYDPLKLLVAEAIAEETGAEISLLQTIPENAPASRRQAIDAYHTDLIRLLTVPTRSRIIETDDRIAGLSRFAGSADLLVTSTEHRGLRGAIFGRPGDSLVEAVDMTAVMVQPAEERQPGLVQRYLLDPLFG